MQWFSSKQAHLSFLKTHSYDDHQGWQQGFNGFNGGTATEAAVTVTNDAFFEENATGFVSRGGASIVAVNVGEGSRLNESAWDLSGELFLNQTHQFVVREGDAGSSSVAGVGEETVDDNWWGLLAIMLVIATAAGNILVCLAISWERRLQNVTNYFLMSLAITDLMVAVLVMPLGILNLVRGFFPLAPVYCLIWICLDVLFCTASIMHLCTISVDRYLSLRYPIKFGRNKTRRRVTLKIVFVWLLSIAMSLPLSLMYSQDYNSVLVDGTCQIPDPLYKLIGSIVCFYIPLIVMLITYALTVRLLAVQQQNLGGRPDSWSSGWMGVPGIDRRYTWRRLLYHPKTPMSSIESTPQHLHHPPVTHHHSSAGSTDTDMTTLDTHELWLPDSEPTPSTLSALHQFGAEMLRLSRGLESVGASLSSQGSSPTPIKSRSSFDLREEETAPFEKFAKGTMGNHVSLSPVRATFTSSTLMKRKVGFQKRRATTVYESDLKLSASRKRGKSLRENTLELYKSYDHDSDLSDSGMDEYLTNEDPFESPEKHSRGDCNNIPKNLHSFRREKSQKTASFERIKSENIINQLNSTLMNDAKMIKGALKLDTGGRGTLVPPTRPPTEGLEGILKSETTDISPFSRSRSGSESNLSESPTVKRNSVSLPKKRPIKDKRSYSIHSSDVKFFRDSNKLLGKAFSLKLNRGGGIGSSPPSGIAVDESSGPRRSRRDKNKGKETERKPSLRTIQNALSDSAKDESSSEDGECSSEKEFSSAMEEEAKLGDTGGIALPPPCRCPYFGETGRGKDGGGGATSVGTKSPSHPHLPSPGPIKDSRERKVSSTTAAGRGANHTIVRWGTSKSQDGDSKVRTEILIRGGVVKEVDVALSTNRPRRSSSATKPILRRAATVRNTVSKEKLLLLNKLSADSPGGLHQAPSPILFRCGSTIGPPSSSNVRNHHSRNSSLMTRNSSRHGRIIRLEQKATKVLGVVFFTFVILWAPFFVLNLLPSICSECERNINKGVFDLVTWLGYASSMVNPIFYTIFNKVFRQTFKKVLLCKYHKTETWKPVPKR